MSAGGQASTASRAPSLDNGIEPHIVASIQNRDTNESTSKPSDLNANNMADVEVALDYIKDRWERGSWHDILPDDLKPHFSMDRPQNWPKAIVRGLTELAEFECEYVWNKLRAALNARRGKAGRSGARIRGMIIGDVKVAMAAVGSQQKIPVKGTSLPRDIREGSEHPSWPAQKVGVRALPAFTLITFRLSLKVKMHSSTYRRPRRHVQAEVLLQAAHGVMAQTIDSSPVSRRIKVPVLVHLQSLHPQAHMTDLHHLIRSARGRVPFAQSLRVRCRAPIRYLLTILLILLRASLARLSKVLDVRVPNERGLQRRRTTQARLLGITQERATSVHELLTNPPYHRTSTATKRMTLNTRAINSHHTATQRHRLR
jgi:hypothetical protein